MGPGSLHLLQGAHILRDYFGSLYTPASPSLSAERLVISTSMRGVSETPEFSGSEPDGLSAESGLSFQIYRLHRVACHISLKLLQLHLHVCFRGQRYHVFAAPGCCPCKPEWQCESSCFSVGGISVATGVILHQLSVLPPA